MLQGRQLNKRDEPCDRRQLGVCTHAGKPAAAPFSARFGAKGESPLSQEEVGSKRCHAGHRGVNAALLTTHPRASPQAQAGPEGVGDFGSAICLPGSVASRLLQTCADRELSVKTSVPATPGDLGEQLGGDFFPVSCLPTVSEILV